VKFEKHDSKKTIVPFCKTPGKTLYELKKGCLNPRDSESFKESAAFCSSPNLASYRNSSRLDLKQEKIRE
jgi:hypothetical protein